MKISEFVELLCRLHDRHGDVEVAAIQDLEGEEPYFNFFKVTGVSYDTYSEDEGVIAEIQIEEDNDR